MSPNSMGQQMAAQQGMANQGGQFPPEMYAGPPPMGGPEGGPPPEGPPPEQGPPMGEMPPETQSQLGGPPGASAPLVDIAKRIARMLDQMDEGKRQEHLVTLQQNNPQLYSFVMEVMQSMAGAHQSSAGMAQPEQKPPRRGPESASV